MGLEMIQERNCRHSNFSYSLFRVFLQEEAICDALYAENRDKISETVNKYADFMIDSMIDYAQILDRIQLLCHRFSCIAEKKGISGERAFYLADFYRMSMSEAKNRRDIFVLLENCASMFIRLFAEPQVMISTNFEDCRNYILSHLEEDITLDSVAQRYGYHPVYFSKKFKHSFQENFRNFLLGSRLDAAAKDLTETNETLLDIAEKYRFCSQSYFQNAFRKLYNMTPTHYRKINRQASIHTWPDTAPEAIPGRRSIYIRSRAVSWPHLPMHRLQRLYKKD